MLVFAGLVMAVVGLYAADNATASKEKGSLLQGTWKVTTVGIHGEHGQSTQGLCASFVLTFNENSAQDQAIEGKPFGLDLSRSNVGGAKAGGAVSFSASYKRGLGTHNMHWAGKLSKDGTQLTDGKFSFDLGAGTFTAEKISFKFSGYDWLVRLPGKSEPGPNYWSGTNAWVDGAGQLHLKLSQRQGTWYCAEVSTQQRLGFGQYQWWVTGRLDNLDKNVVFGLFNYPPADVGSDGTNEIDIEIAKWRKQDAPNGNFSVWPGREKLARHTQTFDVTYSGSNTTHRFNWQRESVLFQCLTGHCSGAGDEIGKWMCQPMEYRD